MKTKNLQTSLKALGWVPVLAACFVANYSEYFYRSWVIVTIGLCLRELYQLSERSGR